ncbi:MAG: hypothetical protein ABI867_33005 [Kofleriaceae bacterium]
MQKTTDTYSAVAVPVADAPSQDTGEVVTDLLSRAAKLCADHGLDLDIFMKGAWAAYMDARPGLREHLEEMQLLGHLDEVRKAGRMGEA